MNKPQPTPETDAHQNDMHRFEFDEELALTYELARKLERELVELREELTRLQTLASIIPDIIAKRNNLVKSINNDLIQIVQEGRSSWETMKAVNRILSNLKPFLA